MLLNFSAVLITSALAVVCLLLVLLVLIQRPRQEGLSPVFGQTITGHCWGPQAGTVLHRITVWLGVLLFTLCLALSLVTNAQSRESSALSIPRAPAANTTPVPAH